MMAPAHPWMIVPVRSLDGGKSRLAHVLGAAERRQFNGRLLDHLLSVAAVWPGLARCVIVSPCVQALLQARTWGAIPLRQPGDGLNQALMQAASHIRGIEPGAALLAVSCDLPLLHADDLRVLQGDGRQCRVATDRCGEGSNALYIAAGAKPQFAFGLGSRRRHQHLCQAQTVHIEGLAFDVDTPEDLAWLQACAA